jgi:hypothetical protein
MFSETCVPPHPPHTARSQLRDSTTPSFSFSFMQAEKKLSSTLKNCLFFIRYFLTILVKSDDILIPKTELKNIDIQYTDRAKISISRYIDIDVPTSTAHRHRVVATQDASGIFLIFASASHILNQIKLAINTPVPYIFNCTIN